MPPMRPWAAVPSFTARDPAMLKWSGLLVRLGGGRQPHFSEDFFSHLDHDILVIDDYGYAGIDFRHKPDLGLLEGEDWDASLGMLRSLFCLCFLMYFLIFCCFLVSNTIFVFAQIARHCDRPGCLRWYGGVLHRGVLVRVVPQARTQIWMRWRSR